MDTQVVNAKPLKLTAAETKLWEAFRDGAQLDLDGPSPIGGQIAGEAWGPNKTVRAELLAAIIMHGPDQNPGMPPRLILKGARIAGRLDVGCGTLTPFLFIECAFDEAPNLNDAHAEYVAFAHCALPGIEADRLDCTGPVLITGSQVRGKLSLEHLQTGDELSLAGSTVEPPHDRVAVDLDGSKIASDLNLSGCTVMGTIRAEKAQIGGRAFLNGTKLSQSAGWAIYGSQVEIGGSMIARDGFIVLGGVYLEGAKIGGKLTMDGAKLSHPQNLCLMLDHAVINLGLSLESSQVSGGIRMHHSRIGCQVTLKDAKIRDVKNEAVRADHIEVQGSLLLNGLDADGPVDFHGARIDCNLIARRLKCNAAGENPAFSADMARIGGHLMANGCEIDGLVYLAAIQVKGLVSFVDSVIRKPGKVAILLQGAACEASFVATGKFSVEGAIDLKDSTFKESVVLTDAVIRNPRGRAIAARGISIRGDYVADRISAEGLVDLADATVDGDVSILDAKLAGLPKDESSRGTDIDRKGGWRGLAIRLTGGRVGGESRPA